MYQNRLPQQCACFVRVNPIRTKHFILDKSYLKVFLIILIWSHFDSPIPRSLYRMRFGQRKTLLEFHIFHLIPSACGVLVVSLAVSVPYVCILWCCLYLLYIPCALRMYAFDGYVPTHLLAGPVAMLLYSIDKFIMYMYPFILNVVYILLG